MLRFTLRRLIVSIPVVIGVAALVFLVMHLVPGDAVSILTNGQGLSASQVAAIRAQLGLNHNLAVQFVDFLSGAIHFNFGVSYQSGADKVTSLVMGRLPATLQLAALSMVFGSLLGIVLGVLAALWQDSAIDRLLMVVSVAGVSVPPFWLAIVLILIFGVRLQWLPVTATTTPSTFAQMFDPSTFSGLVLPVATLALALAAGIARLVRSQMLEVLSQDYIRTAYAKGLHQRRVIVRHALKNALIPAVTLIGIQFGNLVGGTVIIETVFGRPGIGRLLVDSITNKDMPVVQAIVLMVAVSYVGMNLLVDITYRVLDPRIA